MEGFFTRKETESKTRPSGTVHTCASCGMAGRVKTPKMKPYGRFRKKILNIGEAPGEVEDAHGKQWQGKTGKVLQQTYKKLDIDLFEDCLNINSVNCRPMDEKGNNRSPANKEIAACRHYILQIIERYKPRMIILLGGAAINSLIGYRWKEDLGGVTKWRGWTIPDRDFNCWVCPTFHPSYVERGEQEVRTVWEQDLERFFDIVNKPLPEYAEPRIEIIDDLTLLDKWDGVADTTIAIDYETTGLKPHAPGHRIICAAIAFSTTECYTFMLPKTRGQLQPLLKLLKNPGICKMAHNIKFEELWSVNRLKQPVENWIWDSMLAAHVLDNRPGITGLKFQTYVNFGIVDYASEISTYLRAKRKGGNEMNRIHELLKKPNGEEKLLHYCALDAVYEYRLAKKQMEIIKTE